MAAYSAVWGYNNFSDIGQEQLESEFLREGSCSDCPMEPNGKQPITSSRKLVMDDFETFDAANPNKTESAAAYVARQSWLRGKLYVKRVWERYSPDQHSVSMDGAPKRAMFFAHSHPNSSIPSRADYVFASHRTYQQDVMMLHRPSMHWNLIGHNRTYGQKEFWGLNYE